MGEGATGAFGGVTTTAGGAGGAGFSAAGGVGGGATIGGAWRGFGTTTGRCSGAGAAGFSVTAGCATAGCGFCGAGAAGALAAGGAGGAAGRAGGAGCACCSRCCFSSFNTSPGLETLERSSFGLISPAVDFSLEAPDLAAKNFLTRSASSSSTELECVFFSVIPISCRASSTALLFTSSSLAKSLIRIFIPLRNSSRLFRYAIILTSRLLT